jgi:phthalate 4,5-dioxygenase oxygenase subunit
MVITIMWKKRPHHLESLKNGEAIPGSEPLRLLPNTSDWYGRFRTVQNRANDYLIDRDAQKSGRIYSGIETIAVQDQAVYESMGEIADRPFEYLVPSDVMVARTRRRILKAAIDLVESNVPPPGSDNPNLFSEARSGDVVVKEHKSLKDSYEKCMRAATRLLNPVR